MNVGEAIIRNLEAIGVDTVFGGSGQSVAELLFALDKRRETMKTVIIRHEQAASFMACGYAMFSDKLGVCFTTSGPGAVNLISGLGVAYSDSLPILAFTMYAPKEGRGKGDLGEMTGLKRTPNSRQIFSATTKKSFLLDHPEDTCDILEEAINLAFEGRPGPVHIDVDYDVTKEEVPNFREITLNIEPVLPLPKTIVQFTDVLANAINTKKKILALLGYGCIRSHAESEILAFLEKFQIPFMTTMDAKGILPENHPLCLGMTGISGDPGAKQMLKEADVVLALGNSFSKWSVWKWKQGIYDNKTLMHINIDKEVIDKVYIADYSMVSDIKPAITGIMEELSKKISSVEQANPIIRKYAQQKIEYTGDKVHPGQMVKELSELLPEKSIVLGDAGAHMLWLADYLELNKGQIYQNPGIFGPMASHVNGAIGIKCANPDIPVIAGCGDGGYQMGGFELMTAVQNNIPVIWIIFNNGEYGVIKYMHQRTHEGKDVFNRILGPDFAAYARLCGARGYRIERLSDFAGAFQEALAANEPTVIDVIMDPDVHPHFHAYDEEE